MKNRTKYWKIYSKCKFISGGQIKNSNEQTLYFSMLQSCIIVKVCIHTIENLFQLLSNLKLNCSKIMIKKIY